MCLPKATHQKEFDTLSGKLEGKNHILFKKSFDQMFLWTDEEGYPLIAEENYLLNAKHGEKKRNEMVISYTSYQVLATDYIESAEKELNY